MASLDFECPHCNQKILRFILGALIIWGAAYRSNVFAQESADAIRSAVAEAMLQDINTFERSPLTSKGQEALGTILITVMQHERNYQYMNVYPGYFPWKDGTPDDMLLNHLVGAFIVGNLGPQVCTSTRGDHPIDGIHFMLTYYRALLKAGKLNHIPDLDNWMQMDRSELARVVANIQSAETPAPLSINMKSGFPTVLVMRGKTGAGPSLTDTSTNQQPNSVRSTYDRGDDYWQQRQQELFKTSLSEFKPPKIGTTATVVLRVGSPVTGTLHGLDADTVTIDGKVYKKTQIAPGTCCQFFAAEWAAATAKQTVTTERSDYERQQDQRLQLVDAANKRQAAKVEAQLIAQREAASRRQQQASRDQEEAERKDNIDFKGLRLGMTSKQINTFAEQSHWMQSDDSEGYYYMKSAESPRGSEDIASVDGQFYSWERIYPGGSYQDHLLEIRVMSDYYGPRDIENGLKPWLHAVYIALVNKYGSPTQVLIPIDHVSITSFEDGAYVYLGRWVINDQVVGLAIHTHDSRYDGGILYRDARLVSKRKAEQKTTTSL